MGRYKYLVNGSTSDTSGRWIINSSTGLMANGSTWAFGNYSLNVSVNDSSGNGISQVINLEIKPYNYVPPFVDTFTSDGAMFGNFLNHSNVYPSYFFPSNINRVYSSFFVGNFTSAVAPVVWNGSAYFLTTNGFLYRNNASNVSQSFQVLLS